MAQQIIDTGSIGDDGTGDTIRLAGVKINANFDELFALDVVKSDIRFSQNEIITQSSNADIVLQAAGVGTINFGDGIVINDNNIQTARSNENLGIVPSGTGQVVIAGLGFTSGTTISALDSSTININERLQLDGTLTASSAITFHQGVTLESTLDVTGHTTLSTLTVSSNSSFAGTTTIDNVTFNDNIIGTSSNADLELTPGGTGVVNVSNIYNTSTTWC